MTIRNLDASGDWTFGHGRQDYLSGEAAVELNIRTRMLFFLNDCFWAMNFGIDYWNLLGQRGVTPKANLLLQSRTMLASSYGVVQINAVDVVTSAITRRESLRYNIDTIYTRSVRGSAAPTP